MHGEWELIGSDGSCVYGREAYLMREPCPLISLIERRITGVTVTSSEKIEIAFEYGLVLRLYSELGGYESMEIADPNGMPLVF